MRQHWSPDPKEVQEQAERQTDEECSWGWEQPRKGPEVVCAWYVDGLARSWMGLQQRAGENGKMSEGRVTRPPGAVIRLWASF